MVVLKAGSLCLCFGIDVHNPAGPLPEEALEALERAAFVSCFDARLIDGSQTSLPGALFPVLTLLY